MEFDPVLARRRSAEMRARGLWADKTLHDYFCAALRVFPDKAAVVDCSGERALQPVRLTYRRLDQEAARLAAALARLGVRRSDVVSVQLHNCWEVLALALACARMGAVINPLMPIFRERELEFMLNLCESKVLVVPPTYRGRDHAAMARGLLPRVPHVRHLVVLGGSGADAFDAIVGSAEPDGGETAPQAPATRALLPDDVAMVMFTSGTTGEPKGVMHTSNTLLSTLGAALESLEMTPRDVALCAAPMGHMLGLALLGIFPLMAMGTTVIMDAWEAARAVRLIAQEGVTYTAGPTPYLVDLCDAVESSARAPASLRVFCCAGALIPPVLVERADRELNMTVCSLWGMTEVQAGTVTGVAQAREYSAFADGRPPVGMEVRIVDDAGVRLPAGQTGRLLVRGSGVFAGYLKRPELNDVDADGWFDTGDLAFEVNDAGYIRINGRSKDIIKRGGESVPVVEVESLLARRPAVASVAIVGWPDARLGERVCAFVTLRPGASLDLDAMRAFLQTCELTPQYWPERLEVRDELPRTPSGKVRKFRLRELVSRLSQAS